MDSGLGTSVSELGLQSFRFLGLRWTLEQIRSQHIPSAHSSSLIAEESAMCQPGKVHGVVEEAVVHVRLELKIRGCRVELSRSCDVYLQP